MRLVHLGDHPAPARRGAVAARHAPVQGEVVEWLVADFGLRGADLGARVGDTTRNADGIRLMGHIVYTDKLLRWGSVSRRGPQTIRRPRSAGIASWGRGVDTDPVQSNASYWAVTAE
ncbi:hypothetical protein GCM10010519_72570 [Streptomyces lactacystinicus]